jgi:hypothetical protein
LLLIFQKDQFSIWWKFIQDAGQFPVPDDFELYLRYLYKLGIVQIKKQLENGNFVIFISLAEAEKELFKQSGFSTERAL